MARFKTYFLFIGSVLASVLLSDFVGAGPLAHLEKENVAEASEEKPDSLAGLKKPGRDKRNVAYYTQPDFWSWYKYFMATHNQEGIENLDQMYRTYLQNKHRVQEGRSYNHYLTHLSEIYKACANSDDPDCIAESTSKPSAKLVMPAPFRQVVMKGCNPYLDPYCIYSTSPRSAAPEETAPAPVKAAAPILSPLLPLPLRAPLGYYYSPLVESFLSTEQKAELLRICNPSDVECLQYHLRAAYGYRPALSPAPSYSHLSCDPSKDPYCRPTLVASAPSGLYHLYPSCDPASDPFCAIRRAPAAQVSEDAPRDPHCNPLFDRGCNPLTSTRLAGLTTPMLEYTPQDEPAPANLACDPRYDPYCLMGGTAALMKAPPLIPQLQTRSRLGIRGKTKDGHDCYVFYDKDCTPIEPSDLKAGARPNCHPYDPNCGRFNLPAPNTSQGDIIEPHPDCDPEIDFNCRLRRAGPAADEGQKDEPAQQVSGQADASASDVTPEQPRFEDFLRAYMGHYKK